MPVRVKICGITNPADARAAVAAGADALGFMFFAGSSRRVSFAAAADILSQIAAPVMRVGVFVNPAADEVRRAVEEAGVDTLQFHGEETPEFIAGLKPGNHTVRTIKAFRVRDAASLAELPRFATDFWLLDSYVPGARGGTGASFNWDLAMTAKQAGRPIFLAGGLTPENVAEAVRTVRPFAVDVSSGVESAPGRKDHAKLRAFITAAKAV